MKRSMHNIFDTSIFNRNSFIGILLIIVGIIFLFNFTNLNIKIGSSLILLGYLLILFFDVHEKTTKRTITGQQLFLLLTLWLFIVLFLTYNIDADIFFVVVILGIMAMREFVLEFISTRLQTRINILFYFLLIIFIFIIGQRVISIIRI